MDEKLMLFFSNLKQRKKSENDINDYFKSHRMISMGLNLGMNYSEVMNMNFGRFMKIIASTIPESELVHLATEEEFNDFFSKF